MRRILSWVSFITFFVPGLAFASVSFSEVAWMGTSDSSNEEWFELHNSGSDVSLAGWKIYEAAGGTLSFSLSGTIAAGQYLTVCRTTPSVPAPLSGSCDLTGSFGGSGLNNAGEDLVLKDGSGNTVESLDFGSGWPAGDSTTKETMQRSGSSWATAEATPGSGYAGGGNPDDDEEENADDEEETDEETTETASSQAATQKYTTMLVEIESEDVSMPVGTPVIFSLKTRSLTGSEITRGDFFWNMGDGTERLYNKNEEFSHVYEHAGVYVVSLRYYKTYFEEIEPDATDKLTVTINNSSVTITTIHTDGGIEIKNTSSQEIDLSDWVIKDTSGNRFVIPEGTFILANKTLVLNAKRTKLRGGQATLFTPSGGFVSAFDRFAKETSNTSYASPTYSPKTSKASLTEVPEAGDGVDSLSSHNLNERLVADVSSTQKRLPVWVIAFGILLVGSAMLVYFLYTKKEEGKTAETTEDEFELLD